MMKNIKSKSLKTKSIMISKENNKYQEKIYLYIKYN